MRRGENCVVENATFEIVNSHFSVDSKTLNSQGLQSKLIHK